MNRTLRAIVLSAVGLLSAVTSGAANEPRVFKYATTVVTAEDPQHMFWYVPLVKGFFKEAGIDFQPVKMAPASAFPALSSQQINAVMFSGSAPLAALRGAPYVSVFFAEKGAPWSMLVNTKKIKTEKDFVGARCGSGTPAKTATDIACRKMVAQLKGNPAAITYVVVPGGATDYISALRRGVIDSAPALVPPMRYVLEREGFRVMTDMRETYPVQATGLTVNRNAIKDPTKRKLVVDTIRAIQRGMEWMRKPENLAEAAEILKTGMGSPTELTQKDYERAIQDWLKYSTQFGAIDDLDTMWNLLNAGLEFGMYDPAEFKIEYKGKSAVEAGIVDFSLAKEAWDSRAQ